MAYVRSFVYKKFNPFAEVGAAMLIFDPINDTGTNTQCRHANQGNSASNRRRNRV